jgi:hypothetical protein
MGGHLAHRHHDGSHGTTRSVPDGFRLDQATVAAFSAGTLGPDGEARLAQQVAELMPHSWDLPFKPEEALHQLVTHLGGQDQLIRWLEGFPGLPRLTARIYVLLGLLDSCSEVPAVVEALRISRTHEPYPAGLGDLLVPQTNADTLSGLGYTVETLLSDGRRDKAVDVALATADWVSRAVSSPDAPRTDPDDLAELMTHARADISEAAASGTA